jgi:signal transduction histidine kinase
MRGAMANPLISFGKLMGVLAFASKQVEFFTSEHREIAEAIADQVAIALHQAELNEKVTEQNTQLEHRVAERTQELQEANEEIKNFAYIVSHDLRAPLVNLKGFAAELLDSLKIVKSGCDDVLPLVPPAKRDPILQALQLDIPEAIHYIESSVSNMDTFTKAILKLSRLGRLQLEIVNVDVRTVVEKKLEGLGYQISQKNIKVIVGALPTIAADWVSMEQIFGNILANAIAYLVPDRPGEIEISAWSNTHETIFRIRDNGRGIAKEDMDKVFAPFRRAGKQDVPGEGMGLAYVQTLVRRHGGRIWCESQPNLGTTFCFTISNHLLKDNLN